MGVNEKTFNSINYGNVYSHSADNRTCYAGGISGYSYENTGVLNNNYNYGEIISASGLDDEYISKGYAGRISGFLFNATECYSIDTTKVNGSIPSSYTTSDDINGGSMTKNEIDKAITLSIK